MTPKTTPAILRYNDIIIILYASKEGTYLVFWGRRKDHDLKIDALDKREAATLFLATPIAIDVGVTHDLVLIKPRI